MSIYMGGTTYGRPDLFASNYLTWSSSSHHCYVLCASCLVCQVYSNERHQRKIKQGATLLKMCATTIFALLYLY